MSDLVLSLAARSTLHSLAPMQGRIGALQSRLFGF
jgi:hypothetical protein